MRCFFRIALIVVTMVVGPAALDGPAGAQQQSGHEHGDKPHEGTISITGNEFKDKMKVLGGSVGHQTLDSVDVGVFVLQAESPDRLAPGGRGPTHLFNLTFHDAEAGGSIEGVTGRLRIDGPGDEPFEAEIRPFDDYYQATTRLETEGKYLITVDFLANGSEAKTKAFSFHYHRKKQSHQH